MRTIYISIFLLVSGLISCTKEVNIEIPGYVEQFVIDGSIETGQPPFIILSKTKNIYDPTDLNSFLSSFVSGAKITVDDGTTSVQLDEICTSDFPAGSEDFVAQLFGISPEDVGNFNICIYTTFNFAIWGKVGKTYNLTVEFEGKTYTSSTTLLTPTKLDKVFWKESVSYPNYGYSWATLSDNPLEYDAYKWEVRRINKNSDGTEKDPVFTKTFSPVFDDKFFNGMSFDFWYENPMSFRDSTIDKSVRGFYKYGDTVIIKFSKMDKQVYNFLEKKYAQMSSNGSPFAAPANIPTNIIGGALGLWAGYSPSFDTLICVP
jgi:hypothetical protein